MEEDFSIEAPGVEEINEAWRKVVGQETTPDEYNWLEAYLDSLDNLCDTKIDHGFTVEEFNELLRRLML